MKRKHIIAMALAIVLLSGLGFAWHVNWPNEEADIQTQIYNFLLEKGFNPIQASGILATAKQSSNMNCTAVSIPDGECYGLFQWTYVRLENLKQFAEVNDKFVENLDTLQYSIRIQSSTPPTKTRVVCQGFPQICHLPQQIVLNFPV